MVASPYKKYPMQLHQCRHVKLWLELQTKLFKLNRNRSRMKALNNQNLLRVKLSLQPYQGAEVEVGQAHILNKMDHLV